MKNIILKRIQPSYKERKFHKNGRQSSVKQVYAHLDAKETQEVSRGVQNAVINKELKKASEKNIKKKENKIEENKKETVMMDTKEKIELATAIMAEEGQVKAKRLKKDKGLIERKENTIILTEDNRELLKD